jgi:hypothetical protein
MPEGLADGLTRRELVDLVTFLSQLGKPGDYNIGQARVVRTWRTLARTLEAADRLRHHGIETAAVDDPAFQWTSAYSTVDGSLPINDAALVQVYHGGAAGPSQYRFVRATVEVTSPGKVGLKLNDAAGLLAWAGERKLEVSPLMTLDLPAGTHAITFAIEPGRQAPLRVELVDVEGSGAQARVVNGK